MSLNDPFYHLGSFMYISFKIFRGALSHTYGPYIHKKLGVERGILTGFVPYLNDYKISIMLVLVCISCI